MYSVPAPPQPHGNIHDVGAPQAHVLDQAEANGHPSVNIQPSSGVFNKAMVDDIAGKVFELLARQQSRVLYSQYPPLPWPR